MNKRAILALACVLLMAVARNAAAQIETRYDTNQGGGSGTLDIALGTNCSVGDLMTVITAPYDAGTYTASISSGSGDPWTTVKAQNDDDQYMAVFQKVVETADQNQNIVVTTSPGHAANASLICNYITGGSVILDNAVMGGQAGDVATTFTLPTITTTGSNEVILTAAGQSGGTDWSWPVTITQLTRNGSFSTGYYDMASAGVAPSQEITGANNGQPFEGTQVALVAAAATPTPTPTPTSTPTLTPTPTPTPVMNQGFVFMP